MKIFLDTNIIIDALGERKPFDIAAAKILSLADFRKIEIYATSTSFVNSYYLLSKGYGATNALNKIRNFKVICKVSVCNDDVVEKAMNSNFKDFEDAIQYFSAVASGCDIIITRNEKDYKNAQIPVMDSESFIKLYSQKQN